MSQDACYTCARPELVDVFDEFLVNTALPDDDILLPPDHQPPNPELEDEVPNQEAVNGIARAKRPREPAWRDLGLQEMAAQFTGAAGRSGIDPGERLRMLRVDERTVPAPQQDTLRTMR